MSDIKHKWHPIGEMLRVKNDDLESIRYNNAIDDNGRLSDVLQKWISAKPSPVTWGKIIQVLRSKHVNELRIADQIVHNLCNAARYEKYYINSMLL